MKNVERAKANNDSEINVTQQIAPFKVQSNGRVWMIIGAVGGALVISKLAPSWAMWISSIVVVALGLKAFQNHEVNEKNQEIIKFKKAKDDSDKTINELQQQMSKMQNDLNELQDKQKFSVPDVTPIGSPNSSVNSSVNLSSDNDGVKAEEFSPLEYLRDNK
jgi:hypothetical protein